MKKLLLAFALLFAISVPSYAWGPCGPGPGWGHGWGYRGNSAVFWTGFGLTCGALALGTAAAYANPPVYYANPYPVYVNQPVVYSQPAVVYQQAAPQVIYVQQPPQQNVVYVQQQAPPQPVAAAPVQQQVQQVQQIQQSPPQPVAAAPVQQQAAVSAPPSSQSYSVRFQNANGTMTVVPLTQSGSGWLGPQGEYYSSYPTADQMRARYQ